jgi:hypothetical protein
MMADEEPDYDYEAWQAAGSPRDPITGHGPDTFKLPNHPTFSNESIYHGRDGNEGGQWEQNEDKTWTFTPGRTNLEHHSPQELRDYFERVEPGNHLNLPSRSESAPVGRILRGQ